MFVPWRHTHHVGGRIFGFGSGIPRDLLTLPPASGRVQELAAPDSEKRAERTQEKLEHKLRKIADLERDRVERTQPTSSFAQKTEVARERAYVAYPQVQPEIMRGHEPWNPPRSGGVPAWKPERSSGGPGAARGGGSPGGPGDGTDGVLEESGDGRGALAPIAPGGGGYRSGVIPPGRRREERVILLGRDGGLTSPGRSKC